LSCRTTSRTKVAIERVRAGPRRRVANVAGAQILIVAATVRRAEERIGARTVLVANIRGARVAVVTARVQAVAVRRVGAGAILVADIRCARVPVIATGCLPVAVQGMRALTSTDGADVIVARVAVIAALVVRHAFSVDALVAPGLTTGAVAPVVHANVVLTALAAGTFAVRAATVGRNADILGTALRRVPCATDVSFRRVATRGCATPIAAAIRQIDWAAFLRCFTERAWVRAKSSSP